MLRRNPGLIVRPSQPRPVRHTLVSMLKGRLNRRAGFPCSGPDFLREATRLRMTDEMLAERVPRPTSRSDRR